MFVFEGTAYDLLAAAVGVALGVGLGILIASTLGQAFAQEASGLTIQPSVTPRSVIVAYSLGMLVTFATVLVSAYRVSKLNIVAAIRDLPEPPPAPRALVERLLAPVTVIVSGFDQLFRRGASLGRRFLRALWTWWVSAPLSLFRLVWLGFTSGPLTLLLGLALVPLGIQTRSAALYSLGISFTIIGLGLTLRGVLGFFLKRQRALVERIAFTVLGLLLAVYWSLPFNWLEERFGIPDMNSGPEMLFISGVLLVAGAVLMLMYNTDLLLFGLMRLLGGAPRFAPVLRMAIAYPLANRFRTGLTIGIFAVVVFSVIFMATLFRTNSQFFAQTEKLTGGFDLRVTSSSTNPIPDLQKAIARSPNLRRSDFAVVAAQTDLGLELQKDTGQWASYPVRGADASYLANIAYGMSLRAEGYASDEAVWQAVRDRPGYAVIDRFAVASRLSGGTIVIGGPEFKLPGVYLEDETMPPVKVQARDPNSGAEFEVTVIGVIEQEAYLGFGLTVSRETLERNLLSTLPAPTHYIRLAEGVSPDVAGRALENVFFRNGVQSVDQVAEIQTQQRVQRVFEQLLLGFLTLGLVVGVAALGVISTRAVVERRQQIGMLRALGFQRGMVAWSFLIESSFVALLGILLGIGLGLIPAYYMIEEMRVQLATIRFEVPWTEMAVVFFLAYGMALLTTWLPAIQASRVAPAEALRYE
jgi:putative ABC transport system permease protein